MDHGEGIESFKERDPQGNTLRDQGTPICADPAPTVSVGSAGGLKSVSTLQVSVFAFVLENLTGSCLI